GVVSDVPDQRLREASSEAFDLGEVREIGTERAERIAPAAVEVLRRCAVPEDRVAPPTLTRDHGLEQERRSPRRVCSERGESSNRRRVIRGQGSRNDVAHADNLHETACGASSPRAAFERYGRGAPANAEAYPSRGGCPSRSAARHLRVRRDF